MINDDIHSTNVIEEIKSKPNVRVLDNTEAFKFVDFDNEKGLKNSKLEKIITTIFNSDVKEYDSPTNQFLFGSIDADGKRINDGAFDIISKKFAAATKGNVIAIVPDAKSAQVFGATELPALMENPDVHSINGIDKSDLLALAKKPPHLDAADLENIFAKIKYTSELQMAATGLNKSTSQKLSGLDDLLEKNAGINFSDYLKDNLEAKQRLADYLNDLRHNNPKRFKEIQQHTKESIDIGKVAKKWG